MFFMMFTQVYKFCKLMSMKYHGRAFPVGDMKGSSRHIYSKEQALAILIKSTDSCAWPLCITDQSMPFDGTVNAAVSYSADPDDESNQCKCTKYSDINPLAR